MDLIRDLLDRKVVDRNGREMGRVDSLVLELREDRTPRLVAIELGPSVLGSRLHPLVGRCAAALEHIFKVDQGRPVRIPISIVLECEPSVKVDLSFSESAAATVEQRLRQLISRLPLPS